MTSGVNYIESSQMPVRLYPLLPHHHPSGQHQILHCPTYDDCSSFPMSPGSNHLQVYSVTGGNGQHSDPAHHQQPPHPSVPFVSIATPAPSTPHRAPRCVVRQMTPVVESYTKHMVLAGIVLCCCGGLFGLIAFLLASTTYQCFYV
jgi:hypothetical protein